MQGWLAWRAAILREWDPRNNFRHYLDERKKGVYYG